MVTPPDESPNPRYLNMLSKWQEAMIAEGIDVSLFGWLLAMEHQTPIITGKADFPTNIEGFKPYTDHLRPRTGKNTLWLLLHVGCDGNPDNLVSTTTDEQPLLAQARQHLSALLANDTWLPDDCAVAKPDTYAQYLLHCDPLQRFSVGAGSTALLTRLAALWLAITLRNHPQCPLLFRMSASADPIAHALQLIDADIASEWSVERMARKVGMSRSSFAARLAVCT